MTTKLPIGIKLTRLKMRLKKPLQGLITKFCPIFVAVVFAGTAAHAKAKSHPKDRYKGSKLEYIKKYAWPKVDQEHQDILFAPQQQVQDSTPDISPKTNSSPSSVNSKGQDNGQ